MLVDTLTKKKDLSMDQYPKSEERKQQVAKVSYTRAIGSLMHAITCTRPDICFVVGMVSRYKNNPKALHYAMVKRIYRYLKGTTNIALCYQGENLKLIRYSDVDESTNRDERKSTLSYAFIF